MGRTGRHFSIHDGTKEDTLEESLLEGGIVSSLPNSDHRQLKNFLQTTSLLALYIEFSLDDLYDLSSTEYRADDEQQHA